MTKKNMIRVLVVEDDKETAAYIVKGLTECGHIADKAEDGREGLLMADSTEYQVIVAAPCVAVVTVHQF